MDKTIDLLEIVLKIVLKSYKQNCRYLKNAQIIKNENFKTFIIGEFYINESYYINNTDYINNTGHFNSVEFNICFNQFGYYLFSYIISNKLMDVFSTFEKQEILSYITIFCH